MVTLAITLGTYAALNVGLMSLSDWVEGTQRGHPFRQEDWLRYHLGAYFGHAGRDDVFLAGPSAVRENFLSHGIEPRNPRASVHNGALSQGTLEDSILALEYLEAVHGADHVPSTIVLGITARSISGIINETSPFQDSLERYSPHFGVRQEDGEMHLVEKTFLRSWLGRLRFFFKQTVRYRTTLSSTVAYLMGDAVDPEELFAHLGDFRTMLHVVRGGAESPGAALEVVRRLGLARCLMLWLRYYSSPYKYHHEQPRSRETIQRWVSGTGLWGRTYLWEPAEDRESICRLLRRLLRFVERNDASLVVVNLPEHPLSRKAYRPGRYELYLEFLKEGLGDTPFLDLRTLLSEDGFYDIVHTTPAGAEQLTAAVNRFLQGLPARGSK